MAKTYVVILDGAGDRPNPVLYGMTPLEAASTPGLDRLAVRSQHGMLTVIGEGIWPESDSGAMALLSYDPLVHYTGRGPLEGFGLGLVAPGRNAIAFRVNFASFDVAAGRLDRRTARGLSDGQLQELACALRSDVTLDDFDVEFSLTAYSRHRGIVVFTGRGAALSGHVTNTDPGFRNEGPFGFPVKDYPPRPLVARPRIPTAEATSGAAVVSAFVERSAAVLGSHPVNLERVAAGQLPANLLLVRDGGDAPTPLTSFGEKYGRSISLFGQIPAEAGLATLIGGTFTYSRAAKGEAEASYLRRAVREVLDADSEVVFIHLKGPDEPGHDNQPREKTRAIELIDENFIQPMLDSLDENDTVAITSDHATPCELGIHSDDPVAVMVCKPGLIPDDRTRYFEASAAEGRLPVKRAVELMPFLLTGSS